MNNTFQNYLYGENKDISYPQDVIDISTLSILPKDVLWFRPYLAADFPEITCDKKYIFIYSTDHSSTAGQIWWGKGDDINCSDFAEQGIILTNAYQCESPYLMRVPEMSGGEVVCLYYHTDASDPSNSSRQQTHLITTSGGVLHTATWTQRGTVLGGTEPHTGYLKLYKLGAANYKGVHLTTSGIPQNYAFSTTTNGLTFTRGAAYNKSAFLETTQQYKITTGYMFNKYGKWWYIGNIAPVTFSGQTTFCLIRLNDDLTPYMLCKLLNNGEGITIVTNKVQGDLEVYIEGDIAYLFWKQGNYIKNSKYELSNLLEYVNKVYPPVSGVFSYYDFNNNVKDLVGNNNGTPTALTYINDPVMGYVGVFNGVVNTGTKVNLTNVPEFTYNNIGVELFFNSSNTGTGLKCIMAKQNAFGIFADSGILKLYSWGGSIGLKSTSINLNDNVWHKIYVEFRSGVTNGTLLYVDDVLVLTTTITILNQNKKVVIGTDNDNLTSSTGHEINGLIKNVKIFSVT